MLYCFLHRSVMIFASRSVSKISPFKSSSLSFPLSDSMYSFSQGLPGSMNSVLTPSLCRHSRMGCAVNSNRCLNANSLVRHVPQKAPTTRTKHLLPSLAGRCGFSNTPGCIHPRSSTSGSVVRRWSCLQQDHNFRHGSDTLGVDVCTIRHSTTTVAS